MLVATSVATDARVLKEARTLVGAGHQVHIIGKSVPTDYEPPPGITVSSVGASSVLRREGAASLSRKQLPPHVRFARWAMLPTHRNSTFARWARGAVQQAAGIDADVVHAHDFTALAAGHEIATAKGVPLVYDTHELWSGRSREYRPTPLQDRRELAAEKRLGDHAAAVITVGDGIADTLRRRNGWSHVRVVRNTFERPADPVDPGDPVGSGDPVDSGEGEPLPPRPTGLIYAGRLGAHRELETVAAASGAIRADLGLTTRLMGPADGTWLAGFDPGACEVLPPCPPDEVDAHLREAGLVLVALAPGFENHRLALPNKLFHAAAAGVPVVATDLGELAAVVREHGIGTTYRAGDARDLQRAVAAAVADYPALCAAVAAAADALSWTRDAGVLLDLYERLAPAVRRETDHSAPVTGRRSGS